jgi:hypothetical protein
MYQRRPALERPKTRGFEVFVTPKTLFRAGNDVWEPALPETAQKRSFEPETDRDERHGLSFRGVRSTNYDAQLRI